LTKGKGDKKVRKMKGTREEDTCQTHTRERMKKMRLSKRRGTKIKEMKGKEE
jgi:hypothetical protein